AAKLTHPALIRLYESGRCEMEGTALLYVVMELAEENLSQVVPERALTADEAQAMLPVVLKALGHVHGRGFVHGSVKPSNVLAAGEQVKVSSDTLRPVDEPVHGRQALSVYDAPEARKSSLSPTGDVWSLGMTIAEVLTQRLPTWDRTKGTGPVTPAGISQPFADIVQHCLELDPKQRWTVTQISTRLQPEQAALKEAIAKGTTTATLPEKPMMPGKWALGIAAVAIVAVGVVALLMQGNKEPSKPTGPAQEVTAPVSTPATAERKPAQREAKPSAAKANKGSPAGAGAKGAVAQQVMPRVAPSARETIEGKIRVRVRVEVDPAGNVTNARLESAGPSKYFARLSLEAAREWKFTPPQAEGRPVASDWRLQFGFRRTDTEVVPTQVSP
ncbi:MAG TPA: TonB family protein, partial [Terriglobales bacterium]|nr:TonB family protein [Terriglobales bacterium]